MIKYRASTHFDRIEKKEFEEEKSSSSHAWFDTWQEAHEYLKARIKEEVSKCADKLDRLTNKQLMIHIMKEPTDA